MFNIDIPKEDNIDECQRNSNSIPEINDKDVSIPNADDSLLETKINCWISPVIMKLRNKFDGHRNVDHKIFSGKGLRNLGNTWFF